MLHLHALIFVCQKHKNSNLLTG